MRARTTYQRRSWLLIAATIALALLFGAAGGAKLVALDAEVQTFQRFELPLWLMTFVGVAEVAIAGLLLIPTTTTFAAIAASGVMLVAITANLVAGTFKGLALPIGTLLVLVVVGWMRRDRFGRWLTW